MYSDEDPDMNDKSSPQKDEEEHDKIMVEGYDKMLTFLDKGYEVDEELRGEMFLMRKKEKTHVI